MKGLLSKVVAFFKGHFSMRVVNNHAESLVDACAEDLVNACTAGKLKQVRLLFKENPKIDINAVYVIKGKKYTLLQWAIKKNYPKIVQFLVDQPGIILDHRTKDCDPPIYIAASQGRIEIMRILLSQQNINVNPRSNKYCWTPLFVAAWHGNREIVELLLQQPEIDVNADGSNALVGAAKRGHSNIIEILLQHPTTKINAGAPLRWTFYRCLLWKQGCSRNITSTT